MRHKEAIQMRLAIVVALIAVSITVILAQGTDKWKIHLEPKFKIAYPADWTFAGSIDGLTSFSSSDHQVILEVFVDQTASGITRPYPYEPKAGETVTKQSQVPIPGMLLAYKKYVFLSSPGYCRMYIEINDDAPRAFGIRYPNEDTRVRLGSVFQRFCSSFAYLERVKGADSGIEAEKPIVFPANSDEYVKLLLVYSDGMPAERTNDPDYSVIKWARDGLLKIQSVWQQRESAKVDYSGNYRLLCSYYRYISTLGENETPKQVTDLAKKAILVTFSVILKAEHGKEVDPTEMNTATACFKRMAISYLECVDPSYQ